jgi:hypothetical protein
VNFSDPALVRLEWIENAVPSVGEVEVRQVEHEHWVVFFPAAPEDFAPVTLAFWFWSFHSGYPSFDIARGQRSPPAT